MCIRDSLSGYLNAHWIANVAVTAGCDWVHPGYGFLSENSNFAAICKKRGLHFIGPSSEVIQKMGDKIEARKSMIKAGVPVIPGSEGNVKDLAEAVNISKDIGFPVMIKATNGGGGRGISRCDNENEVESNYERVISEATKAFGSPEVFIEKCVLNPKHIEVQILADQNLSLIHI